MNVNRNLRKSKSTHAGLTGKNPAKSHVNTKTHIRYKSHIKPFIAGQGNTATGTH